MNYTTSGGVTEIRSRNYESYIAPPRARPQTAETSVAALPRMNLEMSLKKKMIYDCIMAHPRSTILRISELTGIPEKSITQPLTELRQAALVLRDGYVDNPATGCTAQAWITNPEVKPTWQTNNPKTYPQ